MGNSPGEEVSRGSLCSVPREQVGGQCREPSGASGGACRPKSRANLDTRGARDKAGADLPEPTPGALLPVGRARLLLCRSLQSRDPSVSVFFL